MRLTVAAAVLVALAGCSGDSGEPRPASGFTAGTCIAKDVADEDDRAPDLDSVVDCSEPHVYEILDVVDLPAEALTGTTDRERLANRKDLATLESDEDVSTQKEAFHEFIGVCDRALRKTTEYDDVTVNGVGAEEAFLYPAVAAEVHTPWVNVTPEDQWLDGKRQVICSARFVEAGADPEENAPAKPLSSPNRKPLLAGMGSASFPDEYRPCDDDEAVSRFVGCDRRHHAEMLFSFAAGAVLDERLFTRLLEELTVQGVDPTRLPKKVTRELDRICTDALPAVMKDGYDRSAITGQGFVGSPWDEHTQTIVCGLVPVDPAKDLGPGSFVWTGAEDVPLVDAG